MYPKIIIFGSPGMLGRYISKYFENTFKYNLTSINRDKYDVLDNDYIKLMNLFCNFEENTIIINCIGLIPQKINSNNHYKDYIIINTLFPILLSKICLEQNFKLIHITTDCIFSGKKGNYNEDNISDTEELYGITKSLSENINATIIRTSIIGEEIKNKKSLLEWVKSNEGKSISGYKNVIWGGVTCLKLAQIIEEMISNNTLWSGVRHIYSDPITKYDLVKKISDIYNLNIQLNIDETNVKNLSLTSKYNRLNNDSIEKQLYDMNKFVL